MDLDPDSFWSKTPREVALILEEKRAGQVSRHNNQTAWLAHTIALLIRLKKLPKLQTLYATRVAARKRQHWQEQLAVMRMWIAATAEKSPDRKTN
jgi:hypothetical protein